MSGWSPLTSVAGGGERDALGAGNALGGDMGHT